MQVGPRLTAGKSTRDETARSDDRATFYFVMQYVVSSEDLFERVKGTYGFHDERGPGIAVMLEIPRTDGEFEEISSAVREELVQVMAKNGLEGTVLHVIASDDPFPWSGVR